MPPQYNEFERLFLLEFFVDYVNIQNVSFKYIDSTMCVAFQFLHYPVMRVCEADFIPRNKMAKDTKIVFKGGKSCLFSVHSNEERTIPSQFNLKIVVCQRMKCNQDRERIGEAVVSLGSSFINLLQPPPEMRVPATGVRHDLFPLKDSSDKVVGSVAAFARISCFGKLIITQFQLAQEQDANYMFKGTDADKLFVDDEEMDIPNIDYYDEDEDEFPRDTPYDEIFGYPKESEDEAEGELLDADTMEEEGEDHTLTLGPGSVKDTADGTDAETETATGEKEIYKEMGAVVNGHSIVIRVLKKRKKEKKSSDDNDTQQVQCCCPPEPPLCPYAPKLNVCSCDFPLPPELIPRCPPPSCCSSPPPCCPPPPCCSSPPPCCPPPPPPPSCCPPPPPCCSSSPSSPERRLSLQGKLASFSQSNPTTGFSATHQNPMELEPGVVSMKGDQVFFQASNLPGEPLSDREKKLTNSLYYKPNCNGTLKVAPPEGANNPVLVAPTGPEQLSPNGNNGKKKK